MKYVRKVIIAGNWKMHKTGPETSGFVQALASRLGIGFDACEVVVAPPFTAISAAVQAADGTSIRVAAQNLHWEERGAFTGEVSANMIKDAGCSHVIVGHSERRQYFGETDETVNKKILSALNRGLVPIFCLGETLEEREAGKTFELISIQLRSGLLNVAPEDPKRIVLAYEPVWAIGTGVTATPDQAQEVHAYLREELAGVLSVDIADRVRILYGGSVKPSNARALVGCEDIDGALVGGASLEVADFFGIIEAATQMPA